ncbi:MAG TPA: SPFH domain-containing protein [Pirellulales bacterium]
MTFYRNPRFLVWCAVALASAFVLQQVWHWEVERVDVPAGKFLVRIHRWGRDLPENDVVAPDDSYKGVMFDVLPEGRHFLNPLFWSYEVHEMKQVPPGKCLVVTRLFGRELPAERIAQGNILAQEDSNDPVQGERGILERVLLPGAYRLNPHAYQVEEVAAVEVRVEQVGVRTLKIGKDPQGLSRAERGGDYTVPDGYRGVQKASVPPGTYYLNPYVESITPVEVRSHRVEFSDIEFPSRDGFILAPHVVVEYAVMPNKAPEMLVRLTDSGVLHQADRTDDEKLENEVLQKVILPHIRGYARIEGSNFDARDFILTVVENPAAKMANARESLQQALLAKVKPRCEELGVELRAVALAEFRPPAELSEQISQRELARVEREKNVVRLGQYKAEQDLRSKEALKQQAKEKVAAETRKIQASKKSEQLKEVALLRLTQELANAQLQLDAARKLAEAALSKGRAEAAVIMLENEAETSGLAKAVQGFDNVQSFAQYQVLSKLSPALTEIFASDDSDFARIFANYMTQPANTAPVLVPASASQPAESPRSAAAVQPASALPVDNSTATQDAPPGNNPGDGN